ncbi:hypothetical protein AWC38_SpisGene23916 [Stylophora pistillata]|uniref:Uncharacterized protein n=1 Tax=Stylophora pistillata TaxID=50429 RepID=A0A2B4R7B5_STYPI|nr:hypothetical protein AWC38_SpisGene23916 [Stylophora pistillata]
MAVACERRIPNHVFQSIGLEVEKLAPRYIDDEFFQDEETAASSDEDEVMDDEESCEEESEKDVPVVLLELEYLSLVLKLWLRQISRFQQSDKYPDLEHAILRTQEHAIEPLKDFLKSNEEKNSEELWSEESMCEFYCKSLGAELDKLVQEKKDANFEMSDEDCARVNKTVLLCFRLGLKLDFLDRLKDMSPKSRNHRSLRQWVVIFLRNNYTALNSTDKSSLSKKLLDDIGFDPLSSAAEKILTRARSEIREHVTDPSEWAEFYIEDEFKYSLSFFGKFPFESNKTNEWFGLSPSDCKLYKEDPLRDVITANVVAKENETSITKELLSGISASPNSQLLFHGTDHQSALDILNGRGIYLSAGSQKRDFSSGKGFYLTDNITSALDWAKCKTVKPAILIFQLRDFSSNNKTRRFSLNAPEDLQKWREIVSSFRSGKPSVKIEQILSEYDLIEGPVATFGRQSDGQFVFEPQPSSYQTLSVLRSKQFWRTKLKDNLEHQGTNNVQGQIYEHIFAPFGGYCGYYPSKSFQCVGKMFTNSMPFRAWKVHFSGFSDMIL